MSQLIMRRPALNDLPALPPLPPGYILRDLGENDIESLAALMRTAFQDASWTREKACEELVADPRVRRTFVIEHAGRIVATASAYWDEANKPHTGVLHWVAAAPEQKGKRLGYAVSLAVLHELARLGCQDAELLTDDFRLPAVKTYLDLGFVPDLRDETHAERWTKVREQLAR